MNARATSPMSAAAMALAALLSIDGAHAEAPAARGARALLTGGAQVARVAESHALVIGMGSYRKVEGKGGWPSLRGVSEDVKEVSATFKALGFEVEAREDLTGAELAAVLKRFVDAHGLALDNRLLIYFAGHGESLESAYGGAMGYLVPVDAPLPSADRDGFLRVAFSMNEVESLARRIQSRHALFIFDACFAGTIFTTMRGSGSAAIDYLSSAPVRQFITAGDEHQPVPDQSIFRRQLVVGLTAPPGLNADVNHDGYVTGTELGEFLFDTVKRARKEAQTPRYGKLNDPVLGRGDFVFQLPRTAVPTVDKPVAAATTERGGTFTLSASAAGRPLSAGDVVELGERLTARLHTQPRSGPPPAYAWLLSVEDEGVLRALGPPARLPAPLPAEVELPPWRVAAPVGALRLVAIAAPREVAGDQIGRELLAALLGGGPERVAAEFVITPQLRLQRVRPVVATSDEAQTLTLELRDVGGGAPIREGGRLTPGGKFEVVVRYQPRDGVAPRRRYLYVFGLDQSWSLTLLSAETPPPLPADPKRPAQLSMGTFVVGPDEGNDVFFAVAADAPLPPLDFWSPPAKRPPASGELVELLVGFLGGEIDRATLDRRVAAISDGKLHDALRGASVLRLRTTTAPPVR